MKSVFQVNEKLLDVSLVILRLGIGFVFMYAGVIKLMNPMFAEMFRLSSNLFLLIGVLEVLSGVGVILGLLTRPSALYQIIILLGAIFIVAGGNISNPQTAAIIVPNLGLITISILLLLYGPGKYSLDTKLIRKIDEIRKREIRNIVDSRNFQMAYRFTHTAQCRIAD